MTRRYVYCPMPHEIPEASLPACPVVSTTGVPHVWSDGRTPWVVDPRAFPPDDFECEGDE